MSKITYTNRPLTDAIAQHIGRSGFAAYLNLGDPIDAYAKILPKSLETCGAKVSKAVAQAIIDQFHMDINNSMKENGQPVKIGDVLKFNVRSRAGILDNKTSTIKKSDLRIVASFLKGKQDYEFDLKNTVEGVTISLYSATGVTDGRAINTFTAGENVRINGKNLTLLEGDYVEVSAMVGDVDFGGRCTVVESAADHIIVTPPESLIAVPAGTEVYWIVHGRGGDPEEGQMTESQKSTRLTYTGTPIIAYFTQEGKDRGEFGIDANAIVTVKGAGFTKPNVINAKFGKLEAGGNSFAYAFNPTAITVLDDNTVTCKVSAAEDPDQTDENLSSDSAAGNIVLRLYTQMTRSNDLVARYVAA